MNKQASSAFNAKIEKAQSALRDSIEVAKKLAAESDRLIRQHRPALKHAPRH